MASQEPTDYYQILQISPTAEPGAVHKVYRLLAQRCRPDNKDTGNEAQFRQLSEACHVLNDPRNAGPSTMSATPRFDRRAGGWSRPARGWATISRPSSSAG